MTRSRLASLLLVLAAACQRDPQPAPAELPAPPTPAASAASAHEGALATNAPRAAPSPPPSAAPSPSCAPPSLADPQRLTATWPQRLGERVRMSARIERSIDLMTALVTAKGVRFVVVLGPDQIWEGERERTFRVMGSAQVALGGRVTLPQLLLESDETCDAG